MQVLDFKEKTGKKNNVGVCKNLLFVEKILLQHNKANKTMGRLNCYA